MDAEGDWHQAAGGGEAMESTLVDSANLLAEVAAHDLKAGRIADGGFARHVALAQQRDPKAWVWRFQKRSVDYRVTVTDARGTVVFDSQGRDVGRGNLGLAGARLLRRRLLLLDAGDHGVHRRPLLLKLLLW